MSQVELGRSLGVDGTTVGRWESGAMLPERERLPELAKCLNIDHRALESAWAAAKQAAEGDSLRRAFRALARSARKLISNARRDEHRQTVVRERDLKDLAARVEDVERAPH
jgi:transcriptional regulator with XRE-family HTH domain